MRRASLRVANFLAEATRDLTPPRLETFSTAEHTPGLPRVVWIHQVRSQGPMIQTFLYGHEMSGCVPPFFAALAKLAIPLAKSAEELGIGVGPPLHIGILHGYPCYAAAVDGDHQSSASIIFEDLRALFSRIDDGVYEAATIAVHLLEWDRNSQFCGNCRGALKPRTDMRVKECGECGRLEFPRLSPAIIVLVEKGDTLLLARSARFTAEFFSVLAGFVEPGESLDPPCWGCFGWSKSNPEHIVMNEYLSKRSLHQHRIKRLP